MDDWIKSGKIAAEVREYSKTLIKPGEKIIDIANKIETKIKELGAIPGFPVNISMNEIAAHYAPIPNDEIILDNQIIKIDIGTSYNGAIGDTAYTIDLSNKYSELVKASREALNNVIKILQIGVSLGEIGKTIQETIQSYGYSPIKNLSGHGLGLFSVHMPPSIPNYNTNDNTELKKGQTIAIEPFATNGAGMIKESNSAMIFSQMNKKPVRNQFSRLIFKEIQKYNNLPFTTRWLTAKFGTGRTNLGLRELIQVGNVKEYPPLVEVNNGMVSQAEHSFIIDDKVIITTK
jgi:methionyl aminopeptidase